MPLADSADGGVGVDGDTQVAVLIAHVGDARGHALENIPEACLHDTLAGLSLLGSVRSIERLWIVGVGSVAYSSASGAPGKSSCLD